MEPFKLAFSVRNALHANLESIDDRVLRGALETQVGRIYNQCFVCHQASAYALPPWSARERKVSESRGNPKICARPLKASCFSPESRPFTVHQQHVTRSTHLIRDHIWLQLLSRATRKPSSRGFFLCVATKIAQNSHVHTAVPHGSRSVDRSKLATAIGIPRTIP